MADAQKFGQLLLPQPKTQALRWWGLISCVPRRRHHTPLAAPHPPVMLGFGLLRQPLRRWRPCWRKLQLDVAKNRRSWSWSGLPKKKSCLLLVVITRKIFPVACSICGSCGCPGARIDFCSLFLCFCLCVVTFWELKTCYFGPLLPASSMELGVNLLSTIY
jgi:hypothetical protein